MLYVIPTPVSMEETGETFYLDYSAYIALAPSCTEKIFRQAKLLCAAVEKNLGYRMHLTRGAARRGDIAIDYLKEAENEEAYELSIGADGVRILGTEKSVIWGIQTFIQILEQTGAALPGLIIKDAPYFANRGFYNDVTRGRIPTLETLKTLADRLSRYKQNQLQLYIEHSYLFRDFSEVWADDTPLTPEEILELDAYCADRGVELVPSISTCSHLYKVLRTQSYKELCELEAPDEEPRSACARQQHHTVNICDPRALELVKGLIDEYRPLFATDKFNICADETFDLGKGKSAAYCREKGHGPAYVEYVRQLCQHVLDMGCIPMMWGDVIVEYPELLNEFPEGTQFLNWDYSADVSDEKTKKFAEAGVPFYNCPGVSSWASLIAYNRIGYENIRRMCAYGKQNGAVGILNTDWGDYYHVCQPAFSYIGLVYGAQLSWGEELPLEALNRAVSVLEFGSTDEGLADTITRISDNCIYSWRHFCIFAEKGSDEELRKMALEVVFCDKQAVRTEASAAALAQTRQALQAAFAHVSLDRRQLLADYITALDGVALFNRLGKVLTLRENKGEKTNREEDWALAKELEEWFYYYKAMYRRVSLESELRYVQDVIVYYCAYLRKG